MKLGNYQGKRFMTYSHEDWKKALDDTSKALTLSAFDVDASTGLLKNVKNVAPIETGGETYAVGSLVYKKYDVTTLNTASDLRVNVSFEDLTNGTTAADTYYIGVLDESLPLMSVTRGGADYLAKSVAHVTVSLVFDPTDSTLTNKLLAGRATEVLSNSLNIADLSVPMDKMAVDNRNAFTKSQDVTVWQHHNYGLFIDGSVNPVTEGIIQLNGQDRFAKREGAYFNYVQPQQHHTNTPADGVNVYSFAIRPEEHQPSGTCNFSRIDTAILNVWFEQFSGSAGELFIDPDNKMFIYTVNYNVLRIMSGMGGLAYSN